MIWNDRFSCWEDNDGTKYMPNGTICKGSEQLCGAPVGFSPPKIPEGLPEAFDTLTKEPDKALRYNGGKPFMHYILFFPRVTELLSRVFEGGEHKYDYCNWRKGGKPSKEYIDAAMRHLMKLIGKDEMFDEDYCTHHIGHVLWNFMVMYELGDDPIISSEEDFRAAMVKMDEIKRKREAA